MSNDPFSFDDDDDRTVLRPGGSQPPTAPRASVARQSGISGRLPPLGGINRLEKAASRLLPLLLTIRHSSSHPNPDQLRNRLIQELNEFKQSAHKILGEPKKVTQASYIMCTALDEAAMNTPWGHQANWSQHNLLATFHNEVIGGERFFALLKGLGKNPRDNIDLLELMYVCLSLGFEGSYRIAKDGQNTLAKVRSWLHEVISSVRSTPDAALSLQWQGTAIQESKLPRLTVLWVIAAAALTISSLVYSAYRYSLGARSDTAIAGFFSIKATPLAVNSIAPPPPPLATNNDSASPALSLTQLLQPQIDLALIDVIDTFSEGKVRLLGNNLFASGKTEINKDVSPLLASIAAAMNQFNGNILVTGHSDNVPIRSGRFASNLALSQVRAESVATRISASLQAPERVSPEGRGSLEPIADNSTASGRAKNRRVEISIFY